ncbi:hypothetical protein BpHYR1_008827 [Brachionus plicatilis]|uniref:Uncharacterized protein n=1 Tax=Brachionus plicatilis TaxID=10195 RepID=A0A3M7R757_BRAPC|nr:hypothetical protein BpHYR1_008827 [Brachionus plicatilis]
MKKKMRPLLNAGQLDCTAWTDGFVGRLGRTDGSDGRTDGSDGRKALTDGLDGRTAGLVGRTARSDALIGRSPLFGRSVTVERSGRPDCTDVQNEHFFLLKKDKKYNHSFFVVAVNRLVEKNFQLIDQGFIAV